MKNQQIALEKPTKELMKKFSIGSKFRDKESSLIGSLRGLRTYTPLPSEAQKKNVYVEHLVRQWFSQRMRGKYDELSPEIFELKRKVKISKEHFENSEGRSGYGGENYTLEIPMLLQAELDREEGWTTEVEHREGSYRDDVYKLTLFSRIPIVPLDVRKSGRDAVVFAHRTYADALDTEVLGDIISEHPDYAPHPKDVKLLALWKPKPSEIHIEAKRIDNDPALVLNWDRPYLVTTWAEPNEESFMHLISTSRIPNLDKFIEGGQK